MERVPFTAHPCSECGGGALEAFAENGDTDLHGPFDLECRDCGWNIYVPEETTARSRIAALRQIVREHEARRIDGFLVDAVTANLLVKTYEALSRENREKFGKPRLDRLVDVAWKCAR